MRLSLIALTVALLASSAHAAPIISGNHLLSNEAINVSLGQGMPSSAGQAARIITDLYQQHGYTGVTTQVDGNHITIVEPEGLVAVISGPSPLATSMRLADIASRAEVADPVIGDLQKAGPSNLALNRDSVGRAYDFGISYSNLGQNVAARDLASLSGSFDAPGNIRIDVATTRGLSSERDESENSHYKSASLGLSKNIGAGSIFATASHVENDIGDVSRDYYDYILAGTTTRYSVGHAITFATNTTVKNAILWTKKELEIAPYKASETQKYKAWSSRVEQRFGKHQFNLAVTQGLGGQDEYDRFQLLGSFNGHFTSGQIGYGYSSMLPGNALAIGVTASGFAGTRDMPATERMGLGGEGRGSSHVAGIISGIKGYFGEVNLSAENTALADYGLKPYLSINGGEATSTLGDDVGVYAGEVGVKAHWRGLDAKVNYAKSLRVENLDDDSRINLSVDYRF